VLVLKEKEEKMVEWGLWNGVEQLMVEVDRIWYIWYWNLDIFDIQYKCIINTVDGLE